MPADAAVPASAPSWSTSTAVWLSAVGLMVWPVVPVAGLLVAVPLVGAARRHRSVPRGLRLATIAVLASGYCWLASVLALALFPDVV